VEPAAAQSVGMTVAMVTTKCAGQDGSEPQRLRWEILWVRSVWTGGD